MDRTTEYRDGASMRRLDDDVDLAPFLIDVGDVSPEGTTLGRNGALEGDDRLSGNTVVAELAIAEGNLESVTTSSISPNSPGSSAKVNGLLLVADLTNC